MGIDPMNNISNNNKNTLCTYIILTKSTPEIMRIVHDSIHAKDKKKEDATANRAKLTIRSSRLSTTEGSGRDSTDSAIGRSASFFVP
jgi:hypothetical protein